ncbi:hypothetical protein RO21_11290 [[Actinobacillus] muris]|uniref:Helix-turn-helix domain-containing protein n=1 Tax=Muribacter muris TaxID=67855 RepID=A0A0J5S0Y2_9PAST|nr:helix-turn-helix domain-containing protein [Muribacter muris]KMK50517.1 hypothetical protein RO21_11290 [[Actinobacillus] muris] [Muribacter muris]
MAKITFSTYMKPKEVCTLIGIDPATLYRWTKSGQFPQPIRIGSSPRYNAEKVKAFLDSLETSQEAH